MKNKAPLHIRLGRGAVLVTLCLLILGSEAIAQQCNNAGRGNCPIRHPHHRCGAQTITPRNSTQCNNAGRGRCPNRHPHHRCGAQTLKQANRPSYNARGEKIRWVGIPSPSNPRGNLPDYRYEQSTQGQYQGSPALVVETPYEYPIYPNLYFRDDYRY